ncbi:MAG TPA: GNAT family N-acetyltransferase [Bryobacteraceae bacterium]|nr:GNAT family N-acetyltransferase [Bryobacteraceae bacterium]
MLTIRPAESADVSLILSLVRELADYEREPHAVCATEADLLRDGFGAQPRFHCVIAEWEGQPAGFALYFYNYSTWEGRPGIYLEDLYVRPAFRKRGIGRSIFVWLARLAVKEDLGRIVWQVLDWNQPAIDFYRSLGAAPGSEWRTMRLTGPGIRKLSD